MSLNYESSPDRPKFNFGLEGLAARQELLLKSLIHLLDHRTRHHWTYYPEAAQLWFLAENAKVPVAALGKTCQILRVTKDEIASDSFHFPLKPERIEFLLNGAGTTLLTLLSTNSANVSETSSRIDEDFFRLVRWPDHHLLGTTERIRLSTLMTGSPLSLSALSQRSMVPPQACKEFLEQLFNAGLLKTLPAPLPSAYPRPPPSTNASVTQQLSLIARIRNRLTFSKLSLRQ